MIIDLLTNSPKDQHVAIISSSHIQIIQQFLMRCHFLYYIFFVESSNYHAILRNLEYLKKSNTGIIFCILIIAGKLSVTDIGRIIDKTYGECLKILIVEYDQLLNSLQITGKLNSVIVPEFFSKQKMQISRFNNLSLLKDIFFETDKIDVQDLNFQSTKEIQELIKKKENQLNWKKIEEEWRQTKYSNKSDKYYSYAFRLLITDPNIAKNYYYHKEKVILIDCKDEYVEKKIDLYLPKKEDIITIDKESHDNHYYLIILNSHLLSEPQKKFIALRMNDISSYFLFVTPFFNPQELILRIQEPNSNNFYTFQVFNIINYFKFFFL